MSLAKSANTWVARTSLTPGGAFRLFCFPYAGAGASAFKGWAEHLPAGVDVCGVHLPGREARLQEDPFTRLEPMINELAAALAPYCDVPFAFFGHCMGGLIAFELTRRFNSMGTPAPAHLFISGYRAPHLHDAEASIHDLPEPDFVNKLRQQEAAPDFILADEEMRNLFLPVLRADFAVCETYNYQAAAPLSCPISAFGGLADPKVKDEELHAWSVHTQSAFNCRMLPGGHLFLHSARALLLHLIAQDLQPVLKSSSPVTRR